MLSAFPGKYPRNCSVEHVQFDGFYENFLKVLPGDLQKTMNPVITSFMISSFSNLLVESAMKHDKMKAFLADKTRQYDLVIVESFGTEAFYAFGEYFNASIIATSTTIPTIWLNQAIGNVEPLSLIPNQLLRVHPGKMSFSDRLSNVALQVFEWLSFRLYLHPQQNAIIREYFPNNNKTVQEIIREDISLAFINTHFTISTARPLVPNMIEIGGINIDREIGELPKDLQEFLDSASDHGVVLLSMGSIFQASHLTPDQRSAFIKVLSSLKQKVIWKYNLPDADQLPKNILARDWLPQKEILAHPNVRLFITHGGMLGTTEGFYHGVPMIGIPMFGDQPVNVGRYVQRGFAVQLDKTNLTEEAIQWAVHEVLDNPSYRRNIRALSAAYHDQPMTPQETVVYWCDYVIRHRGAKFLRQTEALRMGIVEYHNLDVWMVIIGLVLGSLWVIIKCGQMCYDKWKRNGNGYRKRKGTIVKYKTL